MEVFSLKLFGPCQDFPLVLAEWASDYFKHLNLSKNAMV